MKVVLMVAEKPSLALSISKILSGGNINTKKGVSSACPIHEFNGSFLGENIKFKMTSVCGHVMSLDFKGYFNNWDAVEPIELFSAATQKIEAQEKLNIVKHLKVAGKEVDFLVLWLDCDKEGENICFEVIDCVKPFMKQSNKQMIYRAHFSAITDKDIKNAMHNLKDPNKNESLSVDARQELDLRVGCAFTRFQTKYFQGKYGNLDSSLISYGPCQTPTLAFCVARHDIIQSFQPETYWKIQASLKPNIILDWERVRIFDREIANLFFNLVKGAKEATVVSIQEVEKKKAPPIALNTVELLRVASSGLGIGPQQTMHIAEKLYTQGFISYPRTETTNYPKSFDLIGPLKLQCGNRSFGEYVSQLLSKGINKPRKGLDAGDHPPITPMRLASPNDLSSDMWKVYDYIVKHFISTVSYECCYKVKTITFSINKEVFSCTGKTVIDPGFTYVMDWQAIPKEESLPSFEINQSLETKDLKLVECLTTPPDYLTESELISLMEKHGIGTDASISVHINNICQRNYVTVTTGRKLIPTPLGIVLVHGYHKIDPELALPTMRAAVERQLNMISSGKADYKAVLTYSVDMFEKKFDYFMKHIDSMDELFECSFTKLSESGKPISRCGKCRRYMKYITTKPYRLHCSNCNETYALPQDGYVKIYNELKCPLDDFELLLWTRGGATKSFPLCPFCFSNPPLDGMKEKSGCNQCTHPTCKHSLAKLSVMECDACDGGVLVLEPFSAPKWQLSCNKCNCIWSLLKNVPFVSVKDDICECGARLLEVHFDKEKSPLPDNKVKHIGCLICDPVISSRSRCLEQSNNINKRQFNRLRGRGRGRSANTSRGRDSFQTKGRGREDNIDRNEKGRRGRGEFQRAKGRRGRKADDDDNESYLRRPHDHNFSEFLNF
ncbi:DNA topoisomerase 3-beta-1 isoform X1 [Hydra vulgaris]|uniref:DNA topoisomerase 3-beta-1 isoform X1 n=1 Tax=Hydra vulgaris TaxID=6087 RepID=UPI001F5F8E60|nr:DNA topoisomerase 3-beta-1 isoform X1 [Hydra vulgaris]